ncbi:MAG: TetR/AcrR family transcriptional regulator [Actinobacteria bacterium]|nr:TetR/AcrR family transcriptional regulator [Actinomycetota bacterium]
MAGDGRVARRLRGRAAAIDAVLELFDGGDLRPSSDVVCERAGISPASLFRYFDGLADLYLAAFEEQVARAAALARIDDVEHLGLDERIARFVAGRIDVYRSVAGVGRMARARAIEDRGVARTLATARRRWLDQVGVVFAPELRSRADAVTVAAVLDAVASFEAWDLLVEGRGLARRTVEESWAIALRAILTPVGSGSPGS